MDHARLRAAYEQVKRELLAERTPDGHWVGELSSSALSTATAVSALAMVRRVQGSGFRVQEGIASGGREPPESASTLDLGPWTLDSLIARGVAYLASQQNPDGGFGDTDLSHSNIATTYLVVAALHLAESAVGRASGSAVGSALRGVPSDLLGRANAYIDSKGGLAGLRERYGIDKTFVVPIMTNLALAGLLDWREIDPLPFELACVPQSLYRFVGMPVVSYAIPALVAIGQARYHHAPPKHPITRLVRWLSITRSLRVLRRMQPDSGGYLEATPLTSFVVMSLASCGPLAPRAEDLRKDAHQPHFRSRSERTTDIADEVIHHGVKFLAASIRPDGSWPIDTNLATWNTTLAINALAGAGEDVAELLLPRANVPSAVGSALRGVPSAAGDGESIDSSGRRASEPGVPTQSVGTSETGNVLDWLLSCQHTKRHPFTGADPGGFGWSDLSGAVPDADDTAGALVAMCHLNERHAWGIARNWLRAIQNADGGWPTFCKGWGRLPFDRSGTDLTAHAIRAFRELGGPRDQVWGGKVDGYFEQLYRSAIDQGLAYLSRTQHPDGSWSPLWFGNQDHPQEDNPVYGTAKVLFAYRDLGLMDSPEAQRGVAWLVANQNADGGWGSGVWGKVRNADCGLRNTEPGGTDGVESEQGIRSAGGAGHSVLSTEYSVPGTGDLSNPKSKIQNLESSVEETALAVEALLAALPRNATEGVPYSAPEPRTLNPEPRNATEGIPYSAAAALEKGLTWLILRVERGEHRQPAPIGFYFAKLWYYERLYPLTFTVAALGRACRQFADRPRATRNSADSETPASTGTTPWTTAAP
jgi:squalene-hopene/tetraprenyl-beta-curcumene cyclase